MAGPAPLFPSRGVYEAAEVDAFVGRLRAHIAELTSKYEACAATLADTSAALDDARDLLARRDTEASILKRTFTAAQRAADEMLANTVAEAEALRASAVAEADATLARARNDAAAVVAAAQAEAAALRDTRPNHRPIDLVAHIDVDVALPPAPPPPELATHVTASESTEEPWRLETAIQRAVNRAVERVPIGPPT